MGMFTDLCKGCDHPLMQIAEEDPPERAWLGEGVAVQEDGSILFGRYNGYGSLEAGTRTYTEVVGFGATAWHQACWELAGSPREYRGPSEADPHQGFSYPFDENDWPPDPRLAVKDAPTEYKPTPDQVRYFTEAEHREIMLGAIQRHLLNTAAEDKRFREEIAHFESVRQLRLSVLEEPGGQDG